ncbi:MAG: ABC transporter permease, partial [Rudaea sp.]
MSSVAEAGRPVSRTIQSSALRRFARRWAMQIGVFALLVAVWFVFLNTATRTFTDYRIYSSLMISTPYFGLVAIPLTLVVITGEIDLSFPSIMPFGMMAYALVWGATGNVYLGFAACLLAGLFAGLINGLIIVRLGIPSLVTTIGTQFLWAGLVILITNAQGIGLTPVKETILYPLFVGRIGGLVPMQFLWMILFGIGGWFLLNRTRFGAHVFLTGDNVESARLMGVDVGRTKILVFTLVGVVAAFAYFVQSVDLLFFWPTGGQGYLMNTLASVFLGGTSVFGGMGSILGTFISCFIIAAINPGVVASGWLSYWSQVIYG